MGTASGVRSILVFPCALLRAEVLYYAYKSLCLIDQLHQVCEVYFFLKKKKNDPYFAAMRC